MRLITPEGRFSLSVLLLSIWLAVPHVPVSVDLMGSGVGIELQIGFFAFAAITRSHIFELMLIRGPARINREERSPDLGLRRLIAWTKAGSTRSIPAL